MSAVGEKISAWSHGLIVLLICLLSLALMLQASAGESAIMDELAHIPAGFSYVRFLDFRLNPEHPPLLKALSALPLLFASPNFPTDSSAWTRDVNGQWAVGTQFIYESGNDADSIVQRSRIGPMLLTIFLIILTYLFSSEFLGRSWALFPTFAFALSPTVLAHGHYVTTDIAAALGVLLATWRFLSFVLEPSRRNLVYAGLALGVAQLVKFSSVLLIPYFIILLAVFYAAGLVRDWSATEAGARLKRFGIRALRFLRSFVVVLLVGYLLVVYPMYFLFTLNYPQERQTTDTEFILGSFAGGPTPEGEICNPVRCLAELDIGMTRHILTRPLAHYLLGVLMVLQRSAGGNTSYFLGEVSAAGSAAYFPVVYLLKEPLPLIILTLGALIWSIARIIKALKRGRPRFLDYLEVSFPEFSMILFIALYWIWSIQSPLNIGFRHLLPTLPFTYILTASAIKRWATAVELPAARSFLMLLLGWLKAALTSSLKHAAVVVLLLWFFAETILTAPYFLSYFNQLGGGVWGGYRYVTDSNYDWGQDLKRLAEWADKNLPAGRQVAVDYFGGGNPKYYLGDRAENWWSSRGNPADQGIRYLAVSINTLQGATQRLHPGQARKPDDEYRWLTSLRPPKPGLGNVPEPDFRAGTSIFIYKL